MNYPTTTAEYRQVTVILEPQALHVIVVLPGQTARPIWFADDRPAGEYANLSERDLGLIEALLTQAKREIDEARERGAATC